MNNAQTAHMLGLECHIQIALDLPSELRLKTRIGKTERIE